MVGYVSVLPKSRIRDPENEFAFRDYLKRNKIQTDKILICSVIRNYWRIDRTYLGRGRARNSGHFLSGSLSVCCGRFFSSKCVGLCYLVFLLHPYLLSHLRAHTTTFGFLMLFLQLLCRHLVLFCNLTFLGKRIRQLLNQKSPFHYGKRLVKFSRHSNIHRCLFGCVLTTCC